MGENLKEIFENLLAKNPGKNGNNHPKQGQKMPEAQLNNLLSQMSDDQAKKVANILADKQATSKLLATPKAQQLLKKFLGEK